MDRRQAHRKFSRTASLVRLVLFLRPRSIVRLGSRRVLMDLSMYPTTVAAVSIESCSSATIETESPLREFIELTELFTSPRRQPHAGTRRPINGDSLYVSHTEHVWNHSGHEYSSPAPTPSRQRRTRPSPCRISVTRRPSTPRL